MGPGTTLMPCPGAEECLTPCWGLGGWGLGGWAITANLGYSVPAAEPKAALGGRGGHQVRPPSSRRGPSSAGSGGEAGRAPEALTPPRRSLRP